MRKRLPWVIAAVLAVVCALTIFAYRDLNRAVEKNMLTDLRELNRCLQTCANLMTKEQGSMTEEEKTEEITRQMKTACLSAGRISKVAHHSMIYRKFRCDDMLSYLITAAEDGQTWEQRKVEIPCIAKAIRMDGELRGAVEYSFLNDPDKLAEKIEEADQLCREYNQQARE